MPLWLALAAALGLVAPAAPPAPPAATEGPAPASPPTAPQGAVPKIPAPNMTLPLGTGSTRQSTDDRLGALGLARQRDGTLLYVDPGKGFTAVFNADGTIRFGDRWNRDQHGNKVKGSRAALREVHAAGFGITGPAEWMLALQDIFGGPELHATAKREFLNRTAELRTEMAIAWTLEVLHYRLGTLERELFAVWSAPGEPAAKRELIFQRWDECDETYAAIAPEGEITAEAASAIDLARADVAEQARRIIEAFIRRQLPRGRPHAYPRRELDDMNARRTSRQEFRPYAPPAPAPERTATP